jgi:ubiquinone/menaquinone biosynthesis C-methylase UbiE
MNPSENPWKTFFDQHAPQYMQEVFTRNTAEEINFLQRELSLPEGSHILDVGCGTGRHAVGLARLGYRVSGVDISSGMLAEARKNARDAGVSVDWIQSDARDIHLDEQVDAAICLCEGSFGLIGSVHDLHTHEREILQAIHRMLKSGGSLILNAPNGLAKIRAATDEDVQTGRFDPMTLTETFEVEISTQQGMKKIEVLERGFVPSEIGSLLELTGFVPQAIYGGTAGAWNRDPVSLDEVEIMAIAIRS